jgi:excisionase family DNA binding protein
MPFGGGPRWYDRDMNSTARTASTREYLTDAEIAKLLVVPVATVAWWRRCGKLPFVRVGRYPRVRAADFEAFVEARMHPLAREACR